MKKILQIVWNMSRYFFYGVLLQTLFIGILFAHESDAQSKLEGNQFSLNLKKVKLSLNVNDATLNDLFREVESSTDFKFFYDKEIMDRTTRYRFKEEITLYELLLHISKESNLHFKQVNKNIYVKGLSEIQALQPDSSQKVSINGKVTSVEDGEPLPGVNIIEKGTSNGSVADANGNYSIQTLEGAILVFSYIGFISEEIPVGGRTVINVSLAPDITSLKEIVVVGYGTVNKNDLTGAVGSIKADEIHKSVASTFENALAGRLAGVLVGNKEGAPGSGVDITIRGGTSLNASNAPLYVIDGYPILGENEDMGGQGITTQSPLVTINPSDIMSIEILKDASSTAIYGARGANGVILITTKRGQLDQKPIVTYDTYVGTQELPRKLDMLSGAEFAQLMTEVYPADSTYINKSTGQIITGPSKNWQDEIYRQALVQSHRLSITGGNRATAYAVSAGYFNQEGIIKGSEFERYTANIRLNASASQKLRFGLNTNIGITENKGIVSATQGALSMQNGATFYGLFYRPIFPVGREIALDENEDINNVNPLTLVERVVQLNNTSRVLGNIFGEYDIITGLKLRISVGGTINSTKIDKYNPGDFGIGRAQGGAIVTLTSRQSLNWLNENTLTYDKKFNQNNRINIVAGFTQQKDVFESMRTEAIGFPLETPDNLDNIGTAKTTRASASTRTEWGLQSFLNRINYILMDRYLFTFTFRADGSSRFAEGHKWGYFPSGAFAWRISDEPFLKNSDLLSDVKLRTSYGLTGNQEIGLYQSLSALEQSNYNFNNALVVGFAPSRIANPDLTWESTQQVDVGLEVGLFKSRMMLELDLYQKNTKDLLLAVPVPFTSGYSVALQNLGEVQNRGIEARLNTVNIANNNFKWSTDINFTKNRNRVISLGEEADEFYTNGSRWNVTSDFVIREGEPVGSIVGYKLNGVFQFEDFEDDENGNLVLKSGIPVYTGSNPVPGHVKFLDTNGDGVVNSLDRQILGNANPDHFGGITNNFTFKNLDLSVFMQWSYGNETYNSTRMSGFLSDGYNNKFKEIKNRWTPENPTNELWSYFGGPQEGILTDFYIEDGSFLRLSNLTLGYTFPKDLLSRLNMNNARFYISGDNLYLFTNYKGYDPDVSVRRDALTPGIDFGAYPRARSIRAGLTLSF